MNYGIWQLSHDDVTFRIVDKENGVLMQDCDDDGEKAAGSRLLHLLEVSNTWLFSLVTDRCCTLICNS